MQVASRPGYVYVLRLTSKLCCGLAVAACSAWCQTTSASLPGLFDRFSVCDPGAGTVAPGRLSFKQQTCWYANSLVAPSMFLHAGFSAAIGQWHNDIYGWGREGSDYAHRFGVFYESYRNSYKDLYITIAVLCGGLFLVALVLGNAAVDPRMFSSALPGENAD